MSSLTQLHIYRWTATITSSSFSSSGLRCGGETPIAAPDRQLLQRILAVPPRFLQEPQHFCSTTISLGRLNGKGVSTQDQILNSMVLSVVTSFAYRAWLLSTFLLVAPMRPWGAEESCIFTKVLETVGSELRHSVSATHVLKESIPEKPHRHRSRQGPAYPTEGGW